LESHLRNTGVAPIGKYAFKKKGFLMCGIAGVFGDIRSDRVRAMLDRMRYRGPDGWGCNDLPNGTLGHRRLAILDVEAGSQPMQSGEDWIVFNGEIYNHQDLKRKYLPETRFQTRTDTEVILELYRRLGPGCVDLLDGMFALAIYDHNADLFLARDPLGIKPLYIAEKGTALYFASEIKALAPIADAIEEFPAGTCYFSKTGWRQYYNVANLPGRAGRMETEQEAVCSIKSVLQSAVRKRLMSDVPVGVSLSGGLDSSIVSWLASRDIPNLNTFAVGVEGSQDIQAARFAARAIGTIHHECVYSFDEMKSVLPEVIYHLESFDPALVRSAIPNYFLARLAAGHVKVFLTGEGADELYAGYAYLNRFSRPEALRDELVQITAALHNTNLQRADRLSMAFGLEARVPFLDLQSVALSFKLPIAQKIHQHARLEKALLREAFQNALPQKIVNRRKQKFSQGAGSSDYFAHEANQVITHKDFKSEQVRLKRDWGYRLQNKEALYYYRVLRQFYKDEWILPGMGVSRSI
jgi:asparagine synthase (glutamine-hydrolysing)